MTPQGFKKKNKLLSFTILEDIDSYMGVAHKNKQVENKFSKQKQCANRGIHVIEEGII